MAYYPVGSFLVTGRRAQADPGGPGRSEQDIGLGRTESGGGCQGREEMSSRKGKAALLSPGGQCEDGEQPGGRTIAEGGCRV